MSPITQTPRAIGYVRVSTEGQAREGVSLDVQAARIRAVCKAKGWALLEIIRDEGRSARELNRPGIARVLELARKRTWSRTCDVVVVLSIPKTHLTRDLMRLSVRSGDATHALPGLRRRCPDRAAAPVARQGNP